VSVGVPKMDLEIGGMVFRHFFGQQIQHFLLNIDAIDAALVADHFGHAPAQVAGARADVGGGFARSQGE
jgi:hypothetical protein